MKITKRRYAAGRLALAVCLTLTVWGCRAEKQAIAKEPGGRDGQTDGVQNVALKTGDGWTLAADWYAPPNAAQGVVILLHQRGGQASDWVPLCRALQRVGIGALAVDQRGAGRSIQGPGPAGEDAPWLTSNDTAAAIAWLHRQGGGTAQSAVGIAGASYGANNALIYASAHPDQVRAIALYSPGANYHGLDAVKPAHSFKGAVIIYHDKNDAITGSGPRQINAALGGEHALHLTNGSEHGTALLTPANIKDTVTFFQKTLKKG